MTRFECAPHAARAHPSIHESSSFALSSQTLLLGVIELQDSFSATLAKRSSVVGVQVSNAWRDEAVSAPGHQRAGARELVLG